MRLLDLLRVFELVRQYWGVLLVLLGDAHEVLVVVNVPYLLERLVDNASRQPRGDVTPALVGLLAHRLKVLHVVLVVVARGHLLLLGLIVVSELLEAGGVQGLERRLVHAS